jgi:D-alanine-D-alanine ligase
VSKVASGAEWAAALDLGFRHDAKLLVEEFVKGREIELAVLEAPDGGLFVSRPGEIVPAESHGFYSYDAKYVDADGAAIRVPAELPAKVEERLKALAAQAFRAVGCDAMARVDFFVTADFDIRLNELNTIPGFTDISMYPKAMAAGGVSYPDLLDRLVAHGMARGKREG